VTTDRILKTLDRLDAKPFKDHLAELRSRLIRIGIVFCVLFFVSYLFAGNIMKVLLIPISSGYLGPDTRLVYTALTEGFFAFVKVAFWTAILFSTPYAVYEIWAFVAPGLYKKEKGFLSRVLFLGGALFLSGGLFGYFVLFPAILSFSLGYAAKGLIPMPRIGQYVVLSVKFFFFAGLVFELPFTMALAFESGIVEIETLRKKRKFIYLGLYCVSAFLIPTDILSQLLLFLPLCLLVELGFQLSRFIRV